jgi:hypothetical protein
MLPAHSAGIPAIIHSKPIHPRHKAGLSRHIPVNKDLSRSDLMSKGGLFREKVVQGFFPVSECNVQHSLAVFLVHRLFLKIPLCPPIHFSERGRASRIHVRNFIIIYSPINKTPRIVFYPFARSFKNAFAISHHLSVFC